MPADSRRPRLYAVSGLRYLAALHLVVYHLALLGFIETASLVAPLRALVEAGYTTTSMFLVLSGFMLFYGYVDGSGQLRTSARRLWWSRFAMLYPLAVLGQLLGLPAALFGSESMGPGEIVARLAAALTLTQAWIPAVAFSLDGPAWTLSCLAAFYALFPWLAARTAQLSRRATVFALGGTWLAAQGLVALALAARPDLISTHGTDSGDTVAVLLHVSPALRVWEFASGVFLARLLLGPWAAAALPAPRAWRSPDVAFAALVAALVVLAERLPFHLLHNGLLLPLHWLLIASLVAGRGLLGRSLSARGVVALGEASLPIFLLHVPLLQYARYAVRRGWIDDGPALVVTLIAGLSAGSWLAARFVVVPLAARLRAWGDAQAWSGAATAQGGRRRASLASALTPAAGTAPVAGG